MKYLIILVAILLCHHNVNASTFMDYVNSKLDSIMTSMTEAAEMIGDKVRNIFVKTRFKSKANDEPRFVDNFGLLNFLKNKSILQKIVQTTEIDINTESPEYLSLMLQPFGMISTPQLAAMHGSNLESHVVRTKDGYSLTVHRILPLGGLKLSNKTVLLHHGLLGSSADWLQLGANKSLPYQLANVGYDVWMTNARGNYYSRNHISRKLNSLDYWEFSWHEMGEFDMPAVVDYIRDVKTSKLPIDFIGHSMGATALLVMLSTLPTYNAYFRIGVLLAPIAFMGNVKGPMRLLSPIAVKPTDQLFHLMGNGEFFPTRRIPEWIAKKYCEGPKGFCVNPLLFIAGRNDWLAARDPAFVGSLLYHVPAGGSTNTILHYAQLVSSKKFHRINNITAEYCLKNVTLPIAFFSSTDDWLAPIADVIKLYDSIANPIDHNIFHNKNWSHTEFVWGKYADILVFSKILDVLEEGLNQTVVKSNEIK